jgi:hypothetical protein
VDHSDPHVSDIDDALLRQRCLERGLVHVPAHGFDVRADAPQLVEEGDRDEVAGVQDQIASAQQADALVGQRSRAAREVRVRDDGDAAQEAAATSPGSCRKRPAFQTSSPSA